MRARSWGTLAGLWSRVSVMAAPSRHSTCSRSGRACVCVCVEERAGSVASAERLRGGAGQDSQQAAANTRSPRGCRPRARRRGCSPRAARTPRSCHSACRFGAEERTERRRGSRVLASGRRVWAGGTHALVSTALTRPPPSPQSPRPLLQTRPSGRPPRRSGRTRRPASCERGAREGGWLRAGRRTV